MNSDANMFLCGVLLLFLLVAQLYKVYKADAEYKKELARYLEYKKRSRKTR